MFQSFMELSREFVFVLELAAGFVGFILALLVLGYRDRPGGVELFVVCFAGGVYGISNSFIGLVGDQLSYVLFHFMYPVGMVVAMGVFLFAVEYTNSTFDSRTVFSLLAGYWILICVLFGINMFEPVMLENVVIGANGEMSYQSTSVFWILHIGAAFAFVIGGIAMLLANAASSPLYRRRSTVLSIGFAVGLVAFSLRPLMYELHEAFNFATVGISLGLVATGYVTLKLDALGQVPVKWKGVVGDLSGLIVIVDGYGRIVDVSDGDTVGPLDIDERVLGQEFKDVFSEFPDVCSYIDERVGGLGEVCIDVNGEERHFQIKSSSVMRDSGILYSGQQEAGVVVSFSEVTERKRREEELNMVSQVLARVLRHNLKNDMNVVRGNVQLMAESDLDDEELSETIYNRIDDILSMGDKARRIEMVVGGEFEREQMNLQNAVLSSISDVKSDFPESEIKSSVSDEVYVEGHRGFEFAIKEAIYNAVEHNSQDELVVSVRSVVEEGVLKLVVEDNGSGIPDSELMPLQNGSETQLEHGSGMGIWLIDMVARRSEATVDIRRTDVGTLVEFIWDVESVDLPDGVEGTSGDRTSLTNVNYCSRGERVRID